MTYKEIRKCVADKTPLTDTASAMDRACHVSLMIINISYTKGAITKDEASAYAQLIERQFNGWKERENAENQRFDKVANMWRRCELAAKRYLDSSNRSEEADELYCAIYNLDKGAIKNERKDI